MTRRTLALRITAGALVAATAALPAVVRSPDLFVPVDVVCVLAASACAYLAARWQHRDR